ncbi:D-aminoacyl-tRNA deacylase [Lysobacter sp. KIS68-7]|uniref:D-aminoacyl-tRNA deacylase n=1 Tax=Lysobacter sp. KIS68-7 TaxID=2904252 RepID=UPI001E5276F9|nr:D-aminoacyl-tRNA deacylase [Lysobacter sp. KIS68-7]UHQ20301.1 D-aminoacyl-tRNA deacylase [Lysobacter sp. KIS68-7]
MLALIQRVTQASVEVDGAIVGAIDAGLLALVGMEPGDTDAQIARLADRVLGYRVFEDGEGRMNLSLKDTGGGLLLVSQFTLAADTRSGMRASFTSAASPAEAEPGFNKLVDICRQRHAGRVETGRFRAHMSVRLVNDGPVTFLLRP